MRRTRITITLTADELAELYALADEECSSAAALAHRWVRRALRELRGASRRAVASNGSHGRPPRPRTLASG